MSEGYHFPFDVFLSHASEDKSAIKDLARELRRVGIRPWIDDEQMPPGTSINHGVLKGLEESQHLLTWITQSWLTKVYPGWEVDLFSGPANRKLIPILRVPWDIKKLGPHLSRFVALAPDIVGKRMLWKVYCGIRQESPGFEDDWELLWEAKVNQFTDTRTTLNVVPDPNGKVDPLQAWRVFVKERYLPSVPRKVVVVSETESVPSDSLLANAVPDQNGWMPRFLLIAEPGAGKTTALRHMAAVLVRDSHPLVPVFVSLSQYARAGVSGSFITFATHGSGVDHAAELLAARASVDRQLVLLLDGLDELAPEAANQIVTQINVLIGDPRLRGMAVVISSRPVSVVDNIRKERVKRVALRPLDEQERKDLIQRIAPEVATELWNRISKLPRLADLAVNPLTLTLLAEMGRRGVEEIPSNAPEVYNRAINLLLARSYAEQPGGGVRFPNEARKLLSAIAFVLYEQGGEAWSYSDVHAAVGEAVQLLDAHRKVADVWRSLEILTADITTNSGVFGAFDGLTEGWRFLHRSMRDYLVAEHLSSISAEERSHRIATWAEASLSNKSSGARWGPILGFLSGMVDDPMSVLDPLTKVNETRMICSILRTTAKLPPGPSLRLLLETPGWEKHDLKGLAQGWEQSPEDTFDSVEPLIRQCAKDSHRLGAIWHALGIDGVDRDRERFFRACDRWPPAVSSVTAVKIANTEVGKAVSWILRNPVTLGDYRLFDPGHVQSPDDSRCPVTGISWYVARLYAAWVDGRLPTMTEWQDACFVEVGGNRWPGDSREYGKVGWNESNARGHLHPVATPPASASGHEHPWDLQDMIGNVFEWCDDELWQFDGVYQQYAGGSFCCPAEEVFGWAEAGVRLDDVGMRIVFGPEWQARPIGIDFLGRRQRYWDAFFRYQSRYPERSTRTMEFNPARKLQVVIQATKEQKTVGDFSRCWTPSDEFFEEMRDDAPGDLYWVEITGSGSLAHPDTWCRLTPSATVVPSSTCRSFNHRLVIFDFDGTLADTADAVVESTVIALRGIGISMTPERLREHLAATPSETLDRLLEQVNPATMRKTEKLRDNYLSRYHQHLSGLATTLFPIAVPLLRRLGEAGAILAILSNSRSDRIRGALRRHDLEKLVSRNLVVGLDDQRVRPKPDPAGINLLMGLAGIAKEDTLLIGDTEEDHKAAAAAGVRFMVAGWSATATVRHPELPRPRDLDECESLGLFEKRIPGT